MSFKRDLLLDKNINFIFGSGASMPYIPTFLTQLKDSTTGKNVNFEELLTGYNLVSDAHKYLIYYYYYKKIIQFTYEPLNYRANQESPEFKATWNNYSDYIIKLVQFLERKSNHTPRRANIFTTNYDLFFESTINEIQQSNRLILNDGGHGTLTRKLNISNFHRVTSHQGIDDRYSYEIPTINLIKMHGSVSWYKCINDIYIYYRNAFLKNDYSLLDDFFYKSGENPLPIENVSDFFNLTISGEIEKSLNEFNLEYKNIPIVNPTKEKFSETVLQQHYYQSLRLLSQELEKPQSVLICFGFSFADEHISEIVQRSLSNPELQLYIFSYSKNISGYPSFLLNSSNVEIITPLDAEKNIDFTEFNRLIFG